MESHVHLTKNTDFFPKQFTVGVLNATLDLAALVLVGVVGFLGSEVVLSPVVSGCLPSRGGWVLVGVAASRSKTFRNQNYWFQSKFAYCKLFGVYAGVIKPQGCRADCRWRAVGCSPIPKCFALPPSRFR